MSSKGGAGSDSGVGAAGKDASKGVRKSKRSKKETDNDKWRDAKSVYKYGAQANPPPVHHPADDDWVPPPILVFFNAKGGTLKTSHTWNTAYTLSSELRGLKVCIVVCVVIGSTSMLAQHRRISTYSCTVRGKCFWQHDVERWREKNVTYRQKIHRQPAPVGGHFKLHGDRSHRYDLKGGPYSTGAAISEGILVLTLQMKRACHGLQQ